MKCEFCDKQGLAVLPVRPALAPVGAHAPAAPEDMLAGAHGLTVKPATYTLRHLRPGYLYTYDEARKRLDAYAVTEGGYLYKLDPGETTPTNLKFSCAPEKCGTVASCVTIPDVKRATKVWFGFSDVQWTSAVIERHKDASYRTRHMQCLDVAAWVGSKKHKGAVDIKQVDSVVAEYALADSAGKAFSFSSGGFKSKASTAKALKERVPVISPAGGIVMSVADPVGIASDLALLMQRNFESFTNHKVRKRELAVSNAISQIEQAVRAQARVNEEAAAEKLANEMASQPDIGMLFKGYRDQKIAQIEEVRTVSEAEAKRAENHAWGRYTAKFDVTAASNWKKKFDAELQAYDKAHIAPFAVAHAAWMKSGAMKNQFECTHDSSDAQSGVVYAKTLQLCIAGTQDKAACFDVYVEWLLGDVTKKENLLLKALTLNLDKTAADIAGGLKVSLDWRAFPLDAILGNFGKATERVAEAKADAVGKLIVAVLGPLAKVVGQAYDGKVRAGLVALGLYTQKTFAVVEVTGGKKAFRAMLIRELLRSNGQVANQRQMERAVSAELKRLAIAGEKLEGTEKKQFLLMVDPEQARAMPAGMTAPQRAKWLASTIRTTAQVEELNLSAWRAKVGHPTKEVIKGSVPYIFGLVSAILQYNAMQKLADDDGKAMRHENTETHQRLLAGQAALAGTITELVGQGLGKIGSVVPRLGAGFRWTGALLGWAGKAAGVCGALIMAWWDGKQALQNYREGNKGVALAYGASAILGLGAAAALLIGWTGVGLILVGLLIAVAVLIEYIKDNKIQDWLERCVWGKGGAHYKTAEEEMAQLKLATSQ